MVSDRKETQVAGWACSKLAFVFSLVKGPVSLFHIQMHCGLQALAALHSASVTTGIWGS